MDQYKEFKESLNAFCAPADHQRMYDRIEQKLRRRSFNIWFPVAGALTAAALAFMLATYFSPAKGTGPINEYVFGGNGSGQSAASQYVFADNGTF